MKKTYKAYLRRIIGTASAERNRKDLTDSVMAVKAPDNDIHKMMRDIVCDARFYSVIENDKFWKDYSTERVAGFIDAIPSETWTQEESRTLLKEEFLNNWLVSHIIPLSEEEKEEIKRNLSLKILEENSKGIPDPGDSDGKSLGIISLGNGIKDKTQCAGEPADGLPPRLKDYMTDSAGGNTPDLVNDGHTADARFLKRIDPSIYALAEKIGRRDNGDVQKKGKFKYASKSDINGVTVGDDLNSLLPSELVLLASPLSEKIFLDRFAKKRLQIFSSASSSKSKVKDKKGPIYVCIDTSGSMTGEPEVLAKTVALAISIIAQKDNRTVCIFNYSGNISFFILRKLKQQKMKLLRFLSESYGGGNDENKLFHFIFDRMPKIIRYREFAKELKGADMLLISDFRWNKLSAENLDLIDNAKNSGMRIFTIGINYEGGASFFPSFLKSDNRYIYSDGKLLDFYDSVK